MVASDPSAAADIAELRARMENVEKRLAEVASDVKATRQLLDGSGWKAVLILLGSGGLVGWVSGIFHR